MRSKAIAIICCVFVLIVAAAAHLGTWEIDKATMGQERYIQHERTSALDDLSEEDQVAASSLSIDPVSFASHLPVVSIDTAGQEIPGESISGGKTLSESSEIYLDDSAPDIRRSSPTYTTATDGRETIRTTFSLFYHEGKANSLTDDPAVQTQAEVRYRGNSSRLHDKKGYRISFTLDNRQTSVNHDILDMGPESDWVLHGPFLDKTLLRNYLAMNITGQIMNYAPDVRFCELFVNDEYQGIYVLMETIKIGEDRLNISESDQDSEETSYVFRRDWYDSTNTNTFRDQLYTTSVSPYAMTEIVYPNERVITDTQRDWIISDINYIEKCLYSYDYDTPPYSYVDILDVDTFVDYAIVNEFSANLDAGNYSTYFYKDIRGLLSAGPVWDFNNAFNNYSSESQMQLGFFMPGQPIYFMLFKDEAFVERVIERYRNLREGVLSEDYLTSFIDSTISYLGPAIERNYSKWGYSFDPNKVDTNNKLNPEERNPRNFEDAVEQLKEFIVHRGAWLDRNIENLRQYSHESANKRYNH